MAVSLEDLLKVLNNVAMNLAAQAGVIGARATLPPPMPPPPSPTAAAGAAGIAQLDRFTRALSDPIKALEEMAASGSRFAQVAGAAAGALKTLVALRGVYGNVQSIMGSGNPNMAGQMQGTLDLMANRMAGAMSPLMEKINAGLQGITDMKPGATIGAGLGLVGGGAATIGVMLAMAIPIIWPLVAAFAVAAAVGGSAIGSWIAGEKALPSMKGLPSPSAGEGNPWYEASMMKALALQPGTIEAENARRQLELLERQIGLLGSIDNSLRGSAPSFR